MHFTALYVVFVFGYEKIHNLKSFFPSVLFGVKDSSMLKKPVCMSLVLKYFRYDMVKHAHMISV